MNKTNDRVIPEAIQKILDEVNARPPAKSVEDRRKAFAHLSDYSGAADPAIRFYDEDHTRIYEGGPRTILYFHGGGYVAGDLETHHCALTQLAARTRATIVHFAYPRAPEHKFPQALYAAQTLLEKLHGKTHNKVTVAGDSAGGNLAAALALARPQLIDKQILLYPTLDARFESETWQDPAEGFIASAPDSREFNKLVAHSEADFDDPIFSPLKSTPPPELPPAFLFAGSLDPARGDSSAYAELLQKHGVSAKYHEIKNGIHGFFTMGARLRETHELYDQIASCLEDSD